MVSDETRIKIGNSLRGDKSPNYGKHWYTNGIDNIFVHEYVFDKSYLELGYYKGKTWLS